MSTVLLFSHPGVEHVPDDKVPARQPTEYAWNAKRQHRRKFLIVNAQLAERSGTGYAARAVRSEVGLWGEWEPPSITNRFDAPGRIMEPEAWHRPIVDHEELRRTDPPPGAQNTDPWIFGASMRYSNCRQSSHKLLRELEEGDVLFFGSLKRRDRDGTPTPQFNFFLDTVFVVSAPAPHDHPSATSDLLFRRAVLERLGKHEERPLTLYSGRTLSEDCAEGFSWVPCRPTLPGDPSSARFARPMINDVLGVAELGNPQLAYKRVDASPRDAWEAVARHCAERQLSMAVHVLP